jgi:CRP-like cAMP-binding protein
MKRVKRVKEGTLMMSQNLDISLINKTRRFTARHMTCQLVCSYLYALCDWIQVKVYTKLIQQSEIQSEMWKHIPQLDDDCTRRKK